MSVQVRNSWHQQLKKDTAHLLCARGILFLRPVKLCSVLCKTATLSKGRFNHKLEPDYTNTFHHITHQEI